MQSSAFASVPVLHLIHTPVKLTSLEESPFSVDKQVGEAVTRLSRPPRKTWDHVYTEEKCFSVLKRVWAYSELMAFPGLEPAEWRFLSVN